MYKRWELRRSVRLPLEVILPGCDDLVRLEASDLSPAGAFIESDLLPDKGEPLVCCFGLRRPDEYCLFANVTRVNLLRRRYDSGPPGFAVSFIDALPLERLRIRQLLRGLPPPVPRPKRDEDPIFVQWLC